MRKTGSEHDLLNVQTPHRWYSTLRQVVKDTDTLKDKVKYNALINEQRHDILSRDLNVMREEISKICAEIKDLSGKLKRPLRRKTIEISRTYSKNTSALEKNNTPQR